MLNTIVFVYGTLRKGCGNHRLLRGATCLGTGQTYGELRRGPGFPAATFHADHDFMIGELYEVSPEILRDLDRLEGYNARSPKNSLYQRVTVPVIDERGNWVEAQAYELHMPTWPVIESGDYLEGRI